jgi:hypothetical protein
MLSRQVEDSTSPLLHQNILWHFFTAVICLILQTMGRSRLNIHALSRYHLSQINIFTTNSTTTSTFTSNESSTIEIEKLLGTEPLMRYLSPAINQKSRIEKEIKEPINHNLPVSFSSQSSAFQVSHEAVVKGWPIVKR